MSSFRNIVAAATLVGGLAFPSAAANASTAAPIAIGASGNVRQLEQAIGSPLYGYAFGSLGGPARLARLVNIQTNVPWAQVAAATPGTPTFANISRWAHAIQASRQPIMVSFSHEPESAQSQKWGTAATFVAAWRRVVTIFRSLGVTNVQWTWTMTSYAFTAPASDPRHASTWYPGDTFVNYVGADGYNWFGCMARHTTQWQDAAQIFAGAMAFATTHHKGLVLPEFGSVSDPANPNRRAQWLNNAHAYFDAHANQLAGVFYFNEADRTCHWQLSSRVDYQAFGGMVHDRAFAHP